MQIIHLVYFGSECSADVVSFPLDLCLPIFIASHQVQQQKNQNRRGEDLPKEAA